jgi:RimJ/RimL family protein N-acetyltransferase
MEIQTERLKLEELSLNDLNAIHHLHSLVQTDEFNTLGIPETIQVTELLLTNWVDQQSTTPRVSYIFAIRLIATNQFVGLIALILGKPKYKIAEVWYKILPDYWRQGNATEALAKLLEFGFVNLGLHRIEAGTAIENIASVKVLEKAGMTREGIKRKILPIRGTWIDNYFYSILETDFEQNMKKDTYK